MKKKILLVSSSLVTGGLEKCIINLCNSFDYEKYDVDLYLFNDGRDLLPMLNPNVTLLSDSPYYSDLFNKSIINGTVALIKKGRINLVLYKLVRFLEHHILHKRNLEKDWWYMKQSMLKIDKHYDVAVGFEEGSANYYITECVDADVKDCWIHTDIRSIDTSYELDKAAFSTADYICTVSENSRDAIIERFPEFEQKIRLFSLPSLYDEKKLFDLANEEFVFDKEYFNVISVGRLVELKGFQFCISACKMLVDDGYPVQWYVAGEGEYREVLERLIEENGLKNSFFLLGNKENPYKYISSAEVCVQPSSYEGYSLVIYEEKLLKKPVILSDIPSFNEMITDGHNGLIVGRDSESIYLAVKKLLENNELLKSLGDTPINGYVTKEETINKIEDTFLKNVEK